MGTHPIFESDFDCLTVSKMESIKHKMECLVKEKDEAAVKADEAEKIAAQFTSEANRYEKEVDKTQRAIAKVEDQLDETISSHKNTQDRLEVVDKEVVDAELQVGALKRRIALLEEETGRSGARLKETQLEEAQEIAKTSNHKYEDVERKLKIVSNDLERIIERAEEFEGKSRATEDDLRATQEKVREMEHIVAENSDKEDSYENKVKGLQEEFKLSDTRAEFAERSVDKLEATIDDLINALYQEKLNYRQISEKLDKT